MTLSTEDVKKIATLARLKLSDDEVQQMSKELDAIVGYVEQLREVDTEGIEPIAQVTGLVNVVREDVVRDMFSIQETLSNAPHANEVAFLVPKAVER